MTAKTVMTDELADTIVRRYQAGETILRVSLDIGLSTFTVRRVLVQRGVERRPAHGRTKVGTPRERRK